MGGDEAARGPYTVSGAHEGRKGRLGPVVHPPRCRTASHLAQPPPQGMHE